MLLSNKYPYRVRDYNIPTRGICQGELLVVSGWFFICRGDRVGRPLRNMHDFPISLPGKSSKRAALTGRPLRCGHEAATSHEPLKKRRCLHATAPFFYPYFNNALTASVSSVAFSLPEMMAPWATMQSRPLSLRTWSTLETTSFSMGTISLFSSLLRF